MHRHPKATCHVAGCGKVTNQASLPGLLTSATRNAGLMDFGSVLVKQLRDVALEEGDDVAPPPPALGPGGGEGAGEALPPLDKEPSPPRRSGPHRVPVRTT